MTVDFTLLATGALSFTVALAWNRAVNQWVESRYPLSSPKASAAHALAAAVIITLVVIAVVEVLTRAHRFGRPAAAGPAAWYWRPAPGTRPAAWYWRPEPGAAPLGGFAPRRPAAPVLSCDSGECRACAHCYPRPIVTLWD